MALDTRIWSTWRRQTSIRSRRAAGRFIAALRDLGDATFLLWTITSRVRDLIPVGTWEFSAGIADNSDGRTRNSAARPPGLRAAADVAAVPWVA